MSKFRQWIQYFQHPHPLQKALLNILLILSILTLFFCRALSGYTSNYKAEVWFYHFTIIERLSILFLLLSVFKKVKELSWIIGELLLLFLVQDIIDRVIFNYKEININDYITIGLLLIIALIKYINKKWQQHKKK